MVYDEAPLRGATTDKTGSRRCRWRPIPPEWPWLAHWGSGCATHRASEHRLVLPLDSSADSEGLRVRSFVAKGPWNGSFIYTPSQVVKNHLAEAVMANRYGAGPWASHSLA